MNKEIKEILDSWKLGIEKGIDKNGIYVDGLCYSWEQLSLLLEYITNLETIEQQYSAVLSENAELQARIDKAVELINNCKEFDDEHIQHLVDLKIKQFFKMREQITQLTNNWNELEEWLKSIIECETLHKGNYMTVRGEWGQEVLDKMKEIKENKDVR